MLKPTALLRAHYQASIKDFTSTPCEAVIGQLAQPSAFAVEPTQLAAWGEQVELLQKNLTPYASCMNSSSGNALVGREFIGGT